MVFAACQTVSMGPEGVQEIVGRPGNENVASEPFGRGVSGQARVDGGAHVAQPRRLPPQSTECAGAPGSGEFGDARGDRDAGQRREVQRVEQNRPLAAGPAPKRSGFDGGFGRRTVESVRAEDYGVARLDVFSEERMGFAVEEREAPSAATAHDRAPGGRHLRAAAAGERQRDDHAGRTAAGNGQPPHHLHEGGEVVPAGAVTGGQRGETPRERRRIFPGTDDCVWRIPDDDVRSGGEGREHVAERRSVGEQCRRGVGSGRRRFDVAVVDPLPEVGEDVPVVVVTGLGRGDAEREGVGDAQVAADAVPLGPRRRICPTRRAQTLVEQDETGGVHRQRIDVDAVEVAFDELEGVQAGPPARGQIEHRLEEHPGSACRIEDERRADLSAGRVHRLAHDVLGDVRGRVEHPGFLLCAPGLPGTRIPHDARSASGTVRVEDVRQEVPEVVVVRDRFERPGGVAVGELGERSGKAGSAPERSRRTSLRHPATTRAATTRRRCGRRRACSRGPTPPAGRTGPAAGAAPRASGWPGRRLAPGRRTRRRRGRAARAPRRPAPGRRSFRWRRPVTCQGREPKGDAGTPARRGRGS